MAPITPRVMSLSGSRYIFSSLVVQYLSRDVYIYIYIHIKIFIFIGYVSTFQTCAPGYFTDRLINMSLRVSKMNEVIDGTP